MTRTRSDPKMLRAVAQLIRAGSAFDREQLARQLDDAAVDIESMAEDLEMERQIMREMAHEISLLKPIKGFKG